MSDMSASKPEVQKKKVEEEGKEGPLDPTTWPGLNMKEYQFPTVPHDFKSRTVATSWVDMIEATREHGEKFQKKLSGNYNTYSCPKCEGYMKITWKKVSDGGAGDVSKSIPCTCAQLSGSSNIIANKAECEKLNELVGHAMLHIATTLGDFVQGFWRYSSNNHDPPATKKRKRARNNGTTGKFTFATEAHKHWVLTTKKITVESKETFKVVSLVSINLLGDETISDSKSAAHSNHSEVANKDTIEEEKTTEADNKDTVTGDANEINIGARGQCLYCCDTDSDRVELICPIPKCDGPELCYPCFNQWASTRLQKPLEKFYHTDFVLIHADDGFPCPNDRGLITEVRYNNNPVTTGIRMPHGWIGDRYERNHASFLKTMETYNVIVLPYVEAYAEAKRYEFQAKEVHDAYCQGREGMKRLLGNNFVDEEDQKYARWFEVLQDAMEHHINEVSKYEWLKPGVSDAGKPPDIPLVDVELAKTKKGIPIDAAGRYPRKAELAEIRAAISSASITYEGGSTPL